MVRTEGFQLTSVDIEEFFLEDASNISFSPDYEFDTLIELIEGCVNDIDEANSFGKNKKW